MQLIPSETLPIDRKARVNMPFYDLDLRPPDIRICDFKAVVIEFSAERAMVEAARCIHCPDPAACMLACPTHNDIPSAMWLIEQGHFSEAANLYHQTSSLPEICGRVCPHEHRHADRREDRAHLDEQEGDHHSSRSSVWIGLRGKSWHGHP